MIRLACNNRTTLQVYSLILIHPGNYLRDYLAFKKPPEMKFVLFQYCTTEFVWCFQDLNAWKGKDNMNTRILPLVFLVFHTIHFDKIKVKIFSKLNIF